MMIFGFAARTWRPRPWPWRTAWHGPGRCRAWRGARWRRWGPACHAGPPGRVPPWAARPLHRAGGWAGRAW